MELTVLSLVFLALLVLGVPVAFSIGLASISTVLYSGMPIAIVFQKMVGGMQIFSFLAIPFFVFAGELMLYGGIFVRSLLPEPYPTPDRMLGRLKFMLRGQYDPNLLTQVVVASGALSLLAAIVGLIGFSRKDV